jgi:hypothetical protein
MPKHASRVQFNRRGKALVCAVLWLASSLARAEDHVTSQQVDEALRRGVNAAMQNLNLRSNLGYTVLCVMALLNAGVSRDDPKVADAIKRIYREAEFASNQYQGTYQCGLVNMLLAMLKEPGPGPRRLAERMALNLRNFQDVNGGWGDYSRTQFGLLGLKAARDLGIEVPPDVFKRAKKFLEQGQNKDGSWGYVPSTSVGYGSMTTAGVSSLFICNEQAYKESPVCGAIGNDLPMQNALKWLGQNFTVRENPKHGSYHYYFLYALERIGVLTGQKYIGGHDWYREGADFLVPRQQFDGSWRGNGGMCETEFAMLFLGKGREPVVMQKLMHNGEWNTDPYDAKDLVEQASRDLKLPMISRTIDAKDGVAALSGAPVLYMQGRKAVEFTKAQRDAIKLFIENGGFLMASDCCNTPEFDKSFRAEMGVMFPDAVFDRLPLNHEIYNLHHRIVNPNAFMIEGLNTGCRTAVFYAPHDICCAWGGCKGCKDKTCLAGADAKNLGVNLIAYALNFTKMRDPLDEDLTIGMKPGQLTPRNALVIGQLYHNGDWNPDPASIANLAETLKKDTGMKGEVSRKQVQLGTDDPGEFPMLYLTGHRKFEYSASQVDALRAYLDRGGFIFADPCCGKLEFDAAFRRLCEQLYPDRPLAEIPAAHSVLQQPYAIDKVEYKPAVLKLFPALGDAPKFEGISAPDGRLQILYSRFNFGCELQGHPCPGCLGLVKTDAYHIAVNAVFYALSH